MADELPAGSTESRAARSLRAAPRSTCPHCGRHSPTVSGGVCADCWGIKDPDRAVVFRKRPQTDPLLDWDTLFGWLDDVPWILLAVLAVVFFVARLALWSS
jgi:hypothetical protein